MPEPKPIFSKFITFDSHDDRPILDKPENFSAAHITYNVDGEPIFHFSDGAIRTLALWRWIFSVSPSGSLSLFQAGESL